MKLTRYKLGEILNVTRGASLSSEFYATEGEYIRLTCGTLTIKITALRRISPKTIFIMLVTLDLNF